MRRLAAVAACVAALAIGAAVPASGQDNSRIDPQGEFNALHRGGSPSRPSTPLQGTGTLTERITQTLARSSLSNDARIELLFLRGTIAMIERRYDDALKDDREIVRLNPALATAILAHRGVSFAAAGRADVGLKMVEEGLAKTPNSNALRSGRARIQLIRGEPDRAIEDLQALVDVGGAESLAARRLRAQAYLAKGAFDQALADYDALMITAPAATDQPKSMQRLELLLWRYVAQAGLRRDPRQGLAGEMKSMNLFQMPGPIGKYLVGQSTAGELEVIAETDKEAQERGARCSVPFFTGVETLRRGDRARAKELFQIAASRCTPGRYETWAAKGYLQRLG